MALPRPNPDARFWLPALLLAAALATACAGGSSVHGITDAALSEADVPAGWQPADFDESQGQTLFDVLPDLLTSNSEARLFVRAYQDETGLHRVATILIEAEEPQALPGTPESERALASLAELLERQDALLTPEVLGVDPGTYFTPIDEPLPGSLRSRLVRLVDEGYLYSDSTIFATGGVMAVVTVWYPEDEGPFRDVDELAAVVEQRLHEYVGG